jgi:ribosomal protein L21E
MKPAACLRNESLWDEARLNLLRSGYRMRKNKNVDTSAMEHKVGDKVLMNTNLDDSTKIPKTVKPIWGALGTIIRRKSAYTYRVKIISAKFNQYNRKKISAGFDVTMHVR